MNSNISSLNPRAVGSTSTDVDYDIGVAEEIIGYRLPNELIDIYREFNAAVMFGKSVKFRTKQLSGWEDASGYVDLNIIYGPARCDVGIITRNKWFSRQSFRDVVFIGESSGGNQICIDKENKHILFWDHEFAVKDGGFFDVADDFAQFLSSLAVMDDQDSATRSIIEGESFLDF